MLNTLNYRRVVIRVVNNTDFLDFPTKSATLKSFQSIPIIIIIVGRLYGYTTRMILLLNILRCIYNARRYIGTDTQRVHRVKLQGKKPKKNIHAYLVCIYILCV